MVKKIIGIVSHEINSNRSKDLEEVLYDVLPNYEIIEKKHEPMKIKGSWKKELKRDIALIEFLYSVGVRVAELTALDRSDVNFEKMEVVVYGKGGREREVYLTPTASMYLAEYLNSRKDEKEALFVSARKPWERLGKEGVESMLKRLGAKSGVKKCIPTDSAGQWLQTYSIKGCK